jgi:hypothetical protein
MSPWPEPPSAGAAEKKPEMPPPPPRTGAYLAVAALVLLGTGLFIAGAVAKVREEKGSPPATVLGVAAWQVATAGFVCTLAGGLWLQRLVK